MTSISKGLYRSIDGAYHIRPVINGRRLWKKLASLTQQDAETERDAILSDHARSKLGLCRDPFKPAPPQSVVALLPAGNAHLRKFFATATLQDINAGTADAYALWRRPLIQRGNGSRTIDMELGQLSKALNIAVSNGWILTNPLAKRRPLTRPDSVRHCRDCMPENGDRVNDIASVLLSSQSPATGWQFLVECMTGLRTEEALALRMDATGHEAGSVENDYLYVRRSKSGVLPYVLLQPDMRAVIQAHHAWHRSQWPDSPWWFPGKSGGLPLTGSALTRALSRIPGRKVTSHGLRAYFVTLHRSRGMGNEQVAALIGDRTSGLIDRVYGAIPEVWSGGDPLSWRRRDGTCCWVTSPAEIASDRLLIFPQDHAEACPSL